MDGNDVETVRAETAAALGVDLSEVDYIDEESIAAALEAEPETEHTEDEASIASLYCNRVQSVTDRTGTQKWAYIRNCDGGPWRFIPKSAVYRIIQAGLCSANPRSNKYKMFYYT